MKKFVKYILGGLALLLFFFLIDDSGVGFKAHIRKVKAWANRR